jgi:hypothetical protein
MNLPSKNAGHHAEAEYIATHRDNSPELAKEVRQPIVTELARKLGSSLLYESVGEKLPESRERETVESILDGVKDTPCLTDLLERPQIAEQSTLVRAIHARIREIEAAPLKTLEFPHSELLGITAAPSLGG